MYAQYQTTANAVRDGDFAPLRLDADRQLMVTTASGALAITQSDSFANYTTGTNTAKTGAGTFSRLIVNDPGSGITATIYDNTEGSGTKIGTVTLSAGMNLGFGVAFSTGLTVVLSGTCDITITYR